MAAVVGAVTRAARWLKPTRNPLERQLNDALAGRHPRTIRASFTRDMPAARLLARDPLVRPVVGLATGEVDVLPETEPASLLDVVQEHPGGVFLTGQPGSGKTTALRWLEDRVADVALKAGGYPAGEVRVPVYVALDQNPNRCLDSSRDLRETIGLALLRACQLTEDVESSESALDFVVREHGLLLLLDGLHMIAARPKAMVSVQEVMRSFESVPNVTVVVSSRADVGNATSLPEFRLSDLDTIEDRVAFLSAHAEARGEPKSSESQRYDRLVGLNLERDSLSNRLLLWIADQTADHLEKPITRTGLFATYSDILRETAWDVPLDRESGSVVTSHRVLTAHCYHTLLSRYDWADDTLALDDWEQWMDRHGGHAEARRVLDHLADTTCLVTRTGLAENPFAFVHPTFVEYFAAAFLAEHFDRRRAAKQLAPYLGHPSLDTLVVFLAGQVPVADRPALLDVLLEWDPGLAAFAVAEWPGSELAYKLPQDGRLLARARAWTAALAWLGDHSEVPWAGAVAAELAYHADTREAALAWLERHPDAELAREVARELVQHDDARSGALAWLRRHPEDSWAWETVLELVEDEASRREALAWFQTHSEDKWAGRIASGLACHDDTRPAVLAWVEAHPEDEWGGRVARHLVEYDDTRPAVLEWLGLQPDARWAGRVAYELAMNDETRWAASRWLGGHREDEWAGRVASELSGHDDSRPAALSWLRTELGDRWASLVAWKLAHHDRTRAVMIGWLQANRNEEDMGRVAAELVNHGDARLAARAWLEAQPGAQWAGRVARQLAGYDETRSAAREWLESHSRDEWGVFVARKLAYHADSRQAMVSWLESHPTAWGAGCVASELAGHGDSRPAVLPLLEADEVRVWSTTVLAEHYDVRVRFGDLRAASQSR